jgi:hypothetical protein
MGHVRFGFAVRCEAVAMPRRQPPDYFRGCAPGPGLALRIYSAKGRTKGIAQKCKGTFTAGQSHRLTSDGKAEAAPTGDY